MSNTLIPLGFAIIFACTCSTQAAVFRRGDKNPEYFKQLNLTPEEIDPDVAPLRPNKIESFYQTTDENLNASNENEILDEGDNEIIDESVNEISQPAVTEAPAIATTLAPVTVAAAVETATPSKAEDEPSGLAKYCKCKESHCDCCREFNLPFIPVKGPGCARMSYLGNQKMSISLKYGDLTLASRTVSSKRARPICVGLPGGYSQFCGRVYGLSKGKENFKACLGFELRADDEVEAALRVSCFKFGAEGLKVAEAEPLPVEVNKEEDEDDDDIFGFDGGADDDEDEFDYDEDEDDDEEAEAEDDADANTDYNDDEAEEDAPADVDYGGFSLAGLFDDLDDDDDEDTKPSSTTAVNPQSSVSAPETLTRIATDSAQSKDDNGTAGASAPALEPIENTAGVTGVYAATDQPTPAPERIPNATAKTKQSKKSKMNKKKKAADIEGDFAYEFLNGLLDLFN